MKKIIVIDDDEKLCNLLKDYLIQFQLEVDMFHHPIEGIDKLKTKHNYELLILDVMLPDMDGFTACKAIRSFSDIPILMLTARGELTDRVVGLEIGADDYLPKPFEPRELVARIQSILRRSNSFQNREVNIYDDGTLYINIETEEVKLHDKELSFTHMEYMCLKILFLANGKKLSRDELMNELQGIDSDVFSRSIDILISRLRSKLNESAKKPKYIKTARGSGYYFNRIRND